MGIKVLSWDIGYKNLAYCIMECQDNKKVNVIGWDVISLADDVLRCHGLKKNGDNCESLACFSCQVDGTTYSYCKTHSKDFQPLKEGWEDIKLPLSTGQTCSYIVRGRNSVCGKKAIRHYIDNNIHLCNTHSKQTIACIHRDYRLNPIKKKKGGYTDFNSAIKLNQELDKRKELLDVDIVMIENQPAFINATMKTLAAYLFNYFVIRGKIDPNNPRIKEINYISPSNKLRVNEDNSIEEIRKIRTDKNDKNKKVYRMTKQLAIEYTKQLLKNNPHWTTHLEKYKKQDDLCDAFLQGYYQIIKHNMAESLNKS